MTDLHAFIAGLPKAELHVHHVGSASPRIVSTLAARHPDSKVPTDPEALADYFTFTDFAHFIDVYLSVVDLSARRRTSACSRSRSRGTWPGSTCATPS